MNCLIDIASVPFRGAALVVNLTFALLLGMLAWLAPQGGLIGLGFALPATLILVPWFLKYCLLVGQEAAYGRRDPPNLSIDRLAPLEIAPIALIAGFGAGYAALYAILDAYAAAVVIALIAPVFIAVLVVEQSVLALLNPLILVRYAVGLGLAYPALAVLLGGTFWLCAWAVGSTLGTFATVFALQSVLIATFHAVGRLLLAREDTIGYARPETSEERTARFTEQEAQRALDDRILHWYRLAEARRPEQALDEIMVYVNERGDALPVYAALYERLVAWPDPTVGLAFARHYVDKLLRMGQSGRALEMFLDAHARNPAVRPLGEAATLDLAHRALAAGRGDVALALYADFEERFPESRFLATALLEQARLLFVEDERPDAALALMDRLDREYPEVTSRREVSRLRQRIYMAMRT